MYPPNIGGAGRWNDINDQPADTSEGTTFPLHGVVEIVPEPLGLLAAAPAVLLGLRRRRT